MRTITLCPACGEDCSEVVAWLDAQRAERFAKFDHRKYDGLLSEWINEVPPVVSRCHTCGHVWYRYQPEPEQLEQMYATGQPLMDAARVTREPTDLMRNEMRRLWKLLGDLTASAALLDFGSGRGQWARAAVGEGFRVVAYEPSVKRSSETDAPFELIHDLSSLKNMTFDVILLEQVLEHVPNPLQTLLNIKQFCHDETILRMTVPNLLRCKEGKNIWHEWPFNLSRVHIMAPFEHLHGFTLFSLIRLSKRAGYRRLPLNVLWKHYPILSIRKLVSHVYPKASQTIMLAKLAI